MFKKILPLCLVASCYSAPIASQPLPPNCGPTEAVKQRLKSKYDEVIIFRGIQDSNSAVELFVSLDNDTFSILITNSNGVSCLVSSGNTFDFTTKEEEKNDV